VNILVIGSGGREHAIVKKLKESPRVHTIYAAPGNGGIAQDAECLDLSATDIDGVVHFVRSANIDFVVVAPDDPLVLGMVDALDAIGVPSFGPNKLAAEIEGSKVFSKALMTKYNIPTAAFASFDDAQKAMDYVDEIQFPVWIKTDGLAMGKGAIQAVSRTEAHIIINELMIQKRFGENGTRVVIEEHMTGPEASIFAFCDGETIVAMPSCMDFKRVYDNDQGLNTGGMGAILPNPYYTEAIAQRAMHEILIPTINAMKAEGRPFKGCLYFGLMLTDNGPKVIEYNCRFGDPECQVLMQMLDSDLLEIMMAVYRGDLKNTEIKFKQGAAACIIMASGGYPETYKTGIPIFGIEAVTTATVYHAGTKLNKEMVTSGGRVLGVTAQAETLGDALDVAYQAVQCVQFEGAHYRKDIGAEAREVQHEVCTA